MEFPVEYLCGMDGSLLCLCEKRLNVGGHILEGESAKRHLKGVLT